MGLSKILKKLFSGGNSAEASSEKLDPTGQNQSISDLNDRTLRSVRNHQQSKFLAFDIEVSKAVPGDFNNWKSYRPLGISCAATLRDGEVPILWYSKMNDEAIAKNMTRNDLIELVEYLEVSVLQGWQIITWNGYGFDFNILAEESGSWEACKRLATNHIDMMYHIFCVKGYPVALDKVARGLSLPGKTAGMTGEKAPILWNQGCYQDILDYVSQDVRTTLDVAKAGIEKRDITWMSNSGKPQHMSLYNGWYTIKEANSVECPDTSWMTKPLSRSDFSDWTVGIKNYSVMSNMQDETISVDRQTLEPEGLNLLGKANIEEINIIFASCDRFDNYEPYDNNEELDDAIEGEPNDVGAMICSCPICMGAPNLDHVFIEREVVDDDDRSRDIFSEED